MPTKRVLNRVVGETVDPLAGFTQVSGVDRSFRQGGATSQQLWQVTTPGLQVDLLRVFEHFDAYSFQSTASVDLWSGSGWVHVYTLYEALVRQDGRPNAEQCFRLDTPVLLRMARLIFTGGVLNG